MGAKSPPAINSTRTSKPGCGAKCSLINDQSYSRSLSSPLMSPFAAARGDAGVDQTSSNGEA